MKYLRYLKGTMFDDNFFLFFIAMVGGFMFVVVGAVSFVSWSISEYAIRIMVLGAFMYCITTIPYNIKRLRDES